MSAVALMLEMALMPMGVDLDSEGNAEGGGEVENGVASQKLRQVLLELSLPP
jgi:hypothetical protein